MISENECYKVLNEGEEKFTKEEVKMIRDFVLAMATIQFEEFKSGDNLRKIDNERYLLQAS